METKDFGEKMGGRTCSRRMLKRQTKVKKAEVRRTDLFGSISFLISYSEQQGFVNRAEGLGSLQLSVGQCSATH